MDFIKGRGYSFFVDIKVFDLKTFLVTKLSMTNLYYFLRTNIKIVIFNIMR